MTNRLREALINSEFIITLELIPGRGAHEEAQTKLLAEAECIYQSGRVHAVSITDNPGGNPAILADTVALELQSKGITAITHFTCKDRNRNQIASQLYAMERLGLENILIMTGDSMRSGWKGMARPVFDLDPVQLLLMVQEMNQGLRVPGAAGAERQMPTHFFAGAVFSPYKWTEAEVLTQYFKLEKKLLSGAQFIITQVGYDSRKLAELRWYLRERGYKTPLLANVYLISAGMARYMKAGNVPGVFISDEFYETLQAEAQAEDKGRQARFLRAAKMIAIARGLGYDGVHIGGVGLNVQSFDYLLDLADQIQPQWKLWAEEIQYGKPQGFYLYESGLSTDVGTSARTDTRANTGANYGSCTGVVSSTNNGAVITPSDSILKRAPLATTHEKGSKIFQNHRISRFFHFWVLTRGKRGYKPLQKSMEKRELRKGQSRSHGLEHLGKSLLYGCLDCGDCGLEATAYSCPMSQCPKCQRNGPCGGSSDGWCEDHPRVYPKDHRKDLPNNHQNNHQNNHPNERYCIYYKAYHRLKKHGEVDKLDTFITLPNNWEFLGTSGWGNYTHERDNTASRLYLPPHVQRAQAVNKQNQCSKASDNSDSKELGIFTKTKRTELKHEE